MSGGTGRADWRKGMHPFSIGFNFFRLDYVILCCCCVALRFAKFALCSIPPRRCQSRLSCTGMSAISLRQRSSLLLFFLLLLCSCHAASAWSRADRLEMRDRVHEMVHHAFDSYMTYAFPRTSLLYLICNRYQ
jgi:hypothetical protein